MMELTIGMRVRTSPTAPDRCGSRWAGLAGHVIGFPGEGNVRIAFDGGEQVTCGPGDVIPEPVVTLTEEHQRRLAQLIERERQIEERSMSGRPFTGPVFTAAG